jgi:glycosyltransferase involved in cell wall biosynthesis
MSHRPTVRRPLAWLVPSLLAGIAAAVVVQPVSARQPAIAEPAAGGLVVPPLPESEFPRRAFNLLEDPGMAARYGAAARVRAAAEFPATRMIEAWAALIDGLDGAP